MRSPGEGSRLRNPTVAHDRLPLVSLKPGCDPPAVSGSSPRRRRTAICRESTAPAPDVVGPSWGGVIASDCIYNIAAVPIFSNALLRIMVSVIRFCFVSVSPSLDAIPVQRFTVAAVEAALPSSPALRAGRLTTGCATPITQEPEP